MVISVYVRTVEPKYYPAGLARAIHFSCETEDGIDRIGLNRNYGILFAKGEIREDNTIEPMGVREPMIFWMEDGLIGICGERVLENGEEDPHSDGKLLLWTTRDLIHFEEEGLQDREEIMRHFPAKELDVPEEIAKSAITYWSPIRAVAMTAQKTGCSKNVSVQEIGRENEGDLDPGGQEGIKTVTIGRYGQVGDGPVTVDREGRVNRKTREFADLGCVEIASEAELEKVRAMVTYNDGSHSYKQISWDKTGINLSKPGVYQIRGRIERPAFKFPLAKGYGDPVIFPWEGKWYYVSTNDNLNDVGIYAREAETVEGLFAEDVKEHLILPFDPERGLEQTFWAPEFHVIGGELYILFAVSGHAWGPQCHVMKLKKGRSIIDVNAWEDPQRVLKKDGSFLAQGAITLDMTYLKTKTGAYVLWSYREGIGTPLDTGSMLFIATVDEGKPWMLTSDPVLLTRPLYGWENVAGTINNEGPNAFVKDGKVYVTYSGGSANAYTYALGLLTADETADLLSAAAWNKSITPVLTYRSVYMEYGPGHNSFFYLPDLMIAYHAETAIDDHLRCDGIRRVHFRKDGTPYFQMSVQEDLPDALLDVQMDVIRV